MYAEKKSALENADVICSRIKVRQTYKDDPHRKNFEREIFLVIQGDFSFVFWWFSSGEEVMNHKDAKAERNTKDKNSMKKGRHKQPSFLFNIFLKITSHLSLHHFSRFPFAALSIRNGNRIQARRQLIHIQ